MQNKVIQQQNRKRAQQSLIWGTVNVVLLAIIAYDLTHTCYVDPSYIQYVEWLLMVIFTFNIVYHMRSYSRSYAIVASETTPKQVKLNDSKMTASDVRKTLYPNLVTNSFSRSSMDISSTTMFSKTPMDMSAASWLSNSYNESMSSPSWSYQGGTPVRSTSPSYRCSPIVSENLSNAELDNEDHLNQYLKEYESLESTQNISLGEKPTNLLSFFWNYPSSKLSKEISPLLSKCQYQLSTPSSLSSSPKSDDKGSPHNTSANALDTWRRLNVDSVALTQWNENLRIWISQTILCRLINEFRSIDKSLHGQGLTDVSIGSVGLDRLRKTAQGPILQNTPNLPTIVPFLELHPNQEYLVKRIRELAKGGCMSEYKWNGGSTYNGKDWDISLPSDAAIIMHLAASYLDTQLIPLPSRPDVKPFSGYHFIKANEKLPELTDNTLAIHEVTVNPPHYRVIIGKEIFEMVKGYNNLFHSILLFLYHVNKKEHGMLGRVNLGRSGVNMLWIIQSN